MYLRGRFRYQTLTARPEGHKRLCGRDPNRRFNRTDSNEPTPIDDSYTELDRDIAPVSPPPFGMTACGACHAPQGALLYPILRQSQYPLRVFEKKHLKALPPVPSPHCVNEGC
ncbi:MAG: hypothetical protein KatS3mg019_2488 [Fimbriimonadales bacterium]|nr:MAG: hypothetical protein KatS3mg019_2488 [Fimbriimonadales bacterium]